MPVAVEPFLRWAGGKRWLALTLEDLIGDFAVNRYHEPFLGGGSIFLNIAPTGPAYLSDLNAELIETYCAVRDDPEAVSEALRRHKNTQDHYYATRASKPRKPSTRAARFIYLNHTSFNGIYRVNLMGVYNVPYGRRTNAQIPTRDRLIEISQKLKGADIRCQDFTASLDRVREGDLVFLDPPYTVAHNNNGFVKYNQKLFSFDDQRRLSTLIDRLRDRGAYYILTNAAHSSIVELFDKGDRLMRKSRRNSVGGKSARRGSASEYVFTNVPQP